MDVRTRSRRIAAAPRTFDRPASRRRGLGVVCIGLGVGLVANSVLGPLLADAIHYPWSVSMRNQAIGLEAVSLLLVAPVIILAGILALRGHPAAPVLAFGPAAYTAYMFLQYVIGPSYTYYAGILPLHLALFVSGVGVAVAAWNATAADRLPPMARRSERRYGALLLALAGFILTRYVPALFAAVAGDRLPAEFRRDVTMYWSIVLLDLGLVVPATVASGIGLIRGAGWNRKALYAVFGWFALVPPSVAAMGIAMVANHDPNAAGGQVVMLAVAAVVFAALTVRLYRPLFASGHGSELEGWR